MKDTGFVRWLSVGALACSLAWGTVPATEVQAQSQSKADEARVRYEKGVELHTEGDFQSALIEFKRSYEVVPNYHVLYNIGQVYFQLADYANALRTFQQYLDDGGKRIPVSRRSDVERDVEKLRSRVATITLKLNVPDAEVRVDDQLVPVPDDGALLVSAGKRRIEVSKSGFKTITRTEEIAGEEKRELKLELSQELTPDDRPIIVPGPATESGPPVVPIILWSLTGALAVGTGVTGALALSADSTLSRLKTESGNSEEQIQSQADQATTLALVTDILLAASIVSAGVSTVFTVLEFTGGEPAKDGAPTTPTASLRVGPLGVFIDGRF
jgi:tetratricopeptide (TPR) repeat protein